MDKTSRRIGRRRFLAGTGAAFAAAAGGGFDALRAQVTGSTPGGGTVPLRLPMGALTYLDRKEYISNMEILAHLPGGGNGATDGNSSTFWTKGGRRVFLNGTDITDPRKPVVAFKPSRNGNGSLAYVKGLKKWISLGSSGPPLTAPTPQFPRGQYDPEYAAKSRNFTGLRGIRTFDVTDPERPTLLQEFSTGTKGGGTHANFWDGGRYAYLDCGWDDQLRMESSERPYSNALMIVDLQDPARIKEVARWWVPGQRYGEEAEYRKYPFAGDGSSWTGCHGGATVPTRIEDGGTLGYVGMGQFGMFTLDLTDVTKPKAIHRMAHDLEAMGGIPYHTIYPIPDDPNQPQLKNHMIAVFECLETDCREPWHTSYVVDATNPREPKIVGIFPRPVPHPDAPYADFCQARGRFSSHNIQPLIAPGQPRADFVALTYFSAGLRIYDIRNPAEPKEVAYWVPPANGDMNQWETWRRRDTSVFVEWDRNIIWVGSNGGLYALSCPFLGKPVLEPKKVERWAMPHLNAGWEDGSATAFHFGRSTSQMV
ncbi:MAG: LVIVD repeat-containing protein [Vicinamibacterales bacterium]